VLFVATILQQIGIEQTTSGKAGFITTLYIVMVPLINLLGRKRTSLRTCFAVYIALVGFVLMCLNEGMSISRGDAIVLYSAVAFSFHIVFVDRYCKNTDPQKLTFLQFATCAVLGIPAMAINGFPTAEVVSASILPILYIGILSSGVAYTLQVFGQKRVESSIATLIMSLESVVALIGGMMILDEQITLKELFGCILVLVAVFIAKNKGRRRTLTLSRSRFFVE
jgi:drug/metabolite transporter (DMT)-like permease